MAPLWLPGAEQPRTGTLVAGRTLFLPLEALYPECRVLTREHPRIRPLACIQDGGCHLCLNARCMETLARRLGRLFDQFPAIGLVLVHWQLEDGTPWGTAFDRAFSPPRVARMQRAALERYLAHGVPLVIPDPLLR